MDTIQQRFLQAEEDFLLAAQSGVQPLSDFAERWQTLQSDWECCIHDADHSTQQLANGVAAKIRMFAGDLLTFESRALSLEDDLLNSIEDAFASLSLEDPIDPQTIPVPEYPPRVSGPSPPDSAEWLLLNLHNPYPLPHLRFSGGRTAGSKHMKDWFSKARQRIGWSRLLRDRFAGCRSLAIDAAFRAFIRDNPNNPLDFDTKTAFLAIKNHAELVYGNNHPSPERHRSISPTPSLTSSASEDTDHDQCATPPSTVYSNRPSKRVILEPSGAHSRKRRRVQPLQSPPSQTRETPSPCAGTISLRHRKRRLSESDHDGSQPKRPRGVEGGRNHSVSDPLPRTEPTWIDFDRSFQIPNPASIDPLELSSFDINFFNPLSLPSCTVSSPSAPPIDIAIPVSLDEFSALFEMPQLDLLQSSHLTFDSDWTEFLNFDPDLPPFPSPSLVPLLENTPPLVDDATLSPSPPDSGPSSPDPLLDTLPHMSNKGVRFHAVGEPIIQEQDFLLPPGENAGIPSAYSLLSVH